MKKKVSKDGVSAVVKNGSTKVECVDLPEGAIAMVEGDKLVFHGTSKVQALPGKPKWTRNEKGKMIPIRSDKDCPEMFMVEAETLDDKTAKVAKEQALWVLKQKDDKMDAEMLNKCSWICKIFRTRPYALTSKSFKEVGAKSFQMLAVVGG